VEAAYTRRVVFINKDYIEMGREGLTGAVNRKV
jgi:hypothetical protein